MSFTLMSPAFAESRFIPPRYTCKGLKFSPPLKWSNTPDLTQSFIVTLTNFDTNFIHWAVYNMGSDKSEIIEAEAVLASTLNSSGQSGYEAPCPPPGQIERYLFTIYALDKFLPVVDTVPELYEQAQNHILDQASFMAYSKG